LACGVERALTLCKTGSATDYIEPMAIELVPLPLPTSAEASKFVDFGREVKGVNPGTLTPNEFKEVEDALYKVRLIHRTK
jgi:hypothetical protein